MENEEKTEGGAEPPNRELPEVVDVIEASPPIKASKSIKAWNKAMLLIQQKLEGAARNADNPYFKGKYADMSAVKAAINAAMAEAGVFLLVEQYPETDYVQLSNKGKGPVPRLSISTIITEVESGEWKQFGLSCYPTEDTPQAIGSAITYMRRYSLMPPFGVAPVEDDGNAGSGKEPKKNDFDQRRPEDRAKPQQRPQGAAQTQPPANPPPGTGSPAAGAESPAQNPDVAPASGFPSDLDQNKRGLIVTAQRGFLKKCLDECGIPLEEFKKYLEFTYPAVLKGPHKNTMYNIQAVIEGDCMFKTIIQDIKKDPTAIFNKAHKPA